MDSQMAKDVTKSYQEVEELCGLNRSRARPWSAAADAYLLNRVLSDVDPDTDRILDFGCCGYPWITNYLDRAGYDVVGADIIKPHWFEHHVARELGIHLVGYDGKHLPLDEDAFDLVLMFGVLEHVGVWKSDDEKYLKRRPEVTDHRREVLTEIERVLDPHGTLYITKFPNTYGRDKLMLRLMGRGIGHLDSERARPKYLRELVGERFDVREMFTNGLLPHGIPLGTPLPLLPLLYAKLNHVFSNVPLLREVAQNYCLVATP